MEHGVTNMSLNESCMFNIRMPYIRRALNYSTCFIIIMYGIYQINDSIYKTKQRYCSFKTKITVHNPQHDKHLIFQHTNMQNK
jgi:hypothetical protein